MKATIMPGVNRFFRWRKVSNNKMMKPTNSPRSQFSYTPAAEWYEVDDMIHQGSRPSLTPALSFYEEMTAHLIRTRMINNRLRLNALQSQVASRSSLKLLPLKYFFALFNDICTQGCLQFQGEGKSRHLLQILTGWSQPWTGTGFLVREQSSQTPFPQLRQWCSDTMFGDIGEAGDETSVSECVEFWKFCRILVLGQLK